MLAAQLASQRIGNKRRQSGWHVADDLRQCFVYANRCTFLVALHTMTVPTWGKSMLARVPSSTCAFAQSGVVDPHELERVAEELSEREGQRDVDTSYPPPLLEPLSHEHPLLRAENPSSDVESRSHSFLPDTSAELKVYLALLKLSMTTSLSTDVRAEGARLERLRTPMSGLRSEIEVHHDASTYACIAI